MSQVMCKVILGCFVFVWDGLFFKVVWINRVLGGWKPRLFINIRWVIGLIRNQFSQK